MKKKQYAQVYLERLELVEAIIEGKKIERQQWFDLALGLSSGGETVYIKNLMSGKVEAHNVEKVQSASNPAKMSDAVIKCLGAADEITKQIDKLVARKKEVTQTLEQLYSPTEYKLLHLRYVQYIPLEDIALKWGVPYTNVTTTHGRAIKNVQRILDERKKYATENT